DQIFQLEPGGPARGLTQATVGGEGETIRRRMFEAASDSSGHLVGAFNVIALYVNDSHRHIRGSGNFSDELHLRELTAGHLQVDFIHPHVEKSGKHGSIPARSHGPPFVIPETEMRGKAAPACDRLDRTIENVYQTAWILAMPVTAHG